MFEPHPPSAVDYGTLEANQTRHYRPVHRLQKDWSIHELGKTLTLHAGSEQYKISTRRSDNQPPVILRDTFIETIIHIAPPWTPQYLVIRKSGNIIGYATLKDKHIVEVFTALSSNITQDNTNRFILNCSKPNLAVLTTPLTTSSYSYDESSASSNNLKVRKIESRRRFSIFNSTSPDDNTCQGLELELPFNALGALLFHIDEVPIPARLALSWFVSQKGICEE